ncbi:unnamed protein product, partial [Linum tenue]
MTSKRKGNWTVEEDKNLCSSWVMISEDGAVGVNQRDTRFWDRVAEQFRSNDRNTSRTIKSMANRMGTITKYCKCWNSAIQRAERNQPSGTNQMDVEHMAEQLYLSETGEKGWNFGHCWWILKRCQKFHTVIIM